jgi:hypothetical protein
MKKFIPTHKAIKINFLQKEESVLLKETKLYYVTKNNVRYNKKNLSATGNFPLSRLANLQNIEQ